MLQLRFINLSQTCHSDPHRTFRIEGRLILGFAEKPIATHEGNVWRFDQRDYHRVECDGPLVVVPTTCSETPPPERPAKTFALYDGVAFVDHEVYATYDHATNAWLFPRKALECRALVLRAPDTK